MILCTISRVVNYLATGRREMVCTSLWNAERHDYTIPIDWLFLCLRGELEHCRRCAEFDRQP